MAAVPNLTAYNYDLMLGGSTPAKFHTAQCEIPAYLNYLGPESAFLVGISALELFCDQYNFKLDCLIEQIRISRPIGILYKFKNFNFMCISLINVGLRTELFRDSKALEFKRVFKSTKTYQNQIFNVEYIFLYREPHEIFLSYEFNFMCLYVDIQKRQFILSTQFLDFIQRKIVIVKPVLSIKSGDRIQKYLKVETSYNNSFETCSSSDLDVYDNFYVQRGDRREIRCLKFKKLVYKLILIGRIFKLIKVHRNYKTVINQINEIVGSRLKIAEHTKPVLNFIHGVCYDEWAIRYFKNIFTFNMYVIDEITLIDLDDQEDINSLIVRRNDAIDTILGLRYLDRLGEKKWRNSPSYRSICTSIKFFRVE